MTKIEFKDGPLIDQVIDAAEYEGKDILSIPVYVELGEDGPILLKYFLYEKRPCVSDRGDLESGLFYVTDEAAARNTLNCRCTFELRKPEDDA